MKTVHALLVLGMTTFAACGGQPARLESAKQTIDALTRQCQACPDKACAVSLRTTAQARILSELAPLIPDVQKGWPPELAPAFAALGDCLMTRAGYPEPTVP